MIPQGLTEAVNAHVKRIDPDFARGIVDSDELLGLVYDQYRTPGIRLSPSSAGDCTRKLWYKLIGVEGAPTDVKSHHVLGTGTALHAFAEEIPRLWEQLPDSVKANLGHQLMARYPDAEFEVEAKAALTDTGIIWTGRFDTVSWAARLINDFKSANEFGALKMLKGEEAPALPYVLQVGVGARILEKVYDVEPFVEGRLAYWPKLFSRWEAFNFGISGYDCDDPNSWLPEYKIDLTAKPVQDAVTMAIKFSERVALIAVDGDDPPPRWKVGLQVDARIDPTPVGRDQGGTVTWHDEITGEACSTGAWFCRFCDYRVPCREDFDAEVAMADDDPHPALARLPETPVHLATMEELTNPAGNGEEVAA